MNPVISPGANTNIVTNVLSSGINIRKINVKPTPHQNIAKSNQVNSPNNNLDFLELAGIK